MNSDSEKAPTENRVHALWARLRRAASSIDGSVWAVWIIAILHYRFTRGIFQGKGSGDGFFGFQYLPGLVFHHSFDLAQAAPQWTAIIGRETTGLVANPCPIGPLLFWFPFYLLGLLLQKLALVPGLGILLSALVPTLKPAQVLSGQTEADLYMAGLGSLFAGLWGIRILFDFLCRHFGQTAARFATCSAVLATPLFWYLTTQPLYQHATAFFAVTMLVDLSDRYRHDLSVRRCLVLGFWSGIAALQRPQEALWMLPLALWMLGLVVSHLRMRNGKRALAVIGKGILIMSVAALLFVPQVLLWLHYYGVLRAPQKPGHFLWDTPAVVESLFSLRAGIFPWVPLTYLSACGLLIALRRHRALTLPLFLTAILELYVNASAWDFHGSWSFGPRRYTDAVVVFAVGLGALFVWLLDRIPKQKQSVSRLLWGLLVLFASFNLMMVELVRQGRNKSSSAGAFSAATRVRWAKGPEFLARLLERTGYPFLQPVSAWYALAYQIPLVRVEDLLGSYVNERDWRIREVVHTPSIVVAENPPQVVEGLSLSRLAGEGNVKSRIRVLIPLVVSEPLRLTLEGSFPGSCSALSVRWNGRRLPIEKEPGPALPAGQESQRAIHIQIDQPAVFARPRFNELIVEDIPIGSKLTRITTTSTTRWWK